MSAFWPKELVHAIACRRCVLFFGAGISMNSLGKDGRTRPPSWADFLIKATEQLEDNKQKKIVKEIKKLISKFDYLTAAEVIRNEIKSEAFNNLVKTAFHKPDFQPAEIHDLLFALDLRISITPNFDGIYEAGAVKRGAGAITVKNYYDEDLADSLRRHESVLIKSHGSISAPNHLIFTRTDYAKARNKNSQFYELLDALLRTHTFIFIGCGMDDPDIRSLLENYCYRHPFGQRHYFVTSSKNFCSEVKDVLSESLKIKILEYSALKDHSQLTVHLRTLVKSVELERMEIGREQTW